MNFKQKNESGITFIGFDTPLEPAMPEPEVGKVYHGFDDGKIRLSRLADWEITKRIDLDKDKIDKKLLDDLAEQINSCHWLYSPEQTIIFEAKHKYGEGDEDDEEVICYFLRTKSGGWFGALSGFLDSELDVDNRWYNKLIKN